LALADLNGDGELDAAVTNSTSGSISILRGGGNGNFRQPVSYPAGADPTSIVAGDFNADGALDLAVVSASVSGRVSVLLNNGAAEFPSARSYSIGHFGLTITAGDLNGDTHLDLVAAGYKLRYDAIEEGYFVANSGISVLLNRGDGVFQLGESYPGLSPGDVTLGNFDGDTDLDLALANTSDYNADGWFVDGTVEIRRGNGDGTFGAATSIELVNTPSAIEAADLDIDGDLDVVAPGDGGLDHGGVNILLGNGDGVFATPMVFPDGDSAVAVAVHELTGDGLPDLAFANSSGNFGLVTVLPGVGGGAVEAVDAIPSGDIPHAVATGDLNSDGIVDVVTANHQFGSRDITIMIGTGGGNFRPPRHIKAGQQPMDVVIAHLNGDPHPDLVVANYNIHGVAILLGLGNGVFAAPATYSTGKPVYAATPGDFDNDGDLDLAVLSFGTLDGRVSVLLGNGDGTFVHGGAFGTLKSPIRIASGDLSGDGRRDVVTLSTDGVAVFLGNGDGTFQTPVAYGYISWQTDLELADFDGDHRPDVAVSTEINKVMILRNNGDGTLAAPVPAATGTSALALIAGDFNNDGAIDLATDSGGFSVSVLMGNGNGSFQAPFHHITDVGLGAIATADLNGDGFLDLVTTHLDSVAILPNAADWPPLPIGDAGRIAVPTLYRAETRWFNLRDSDSDFVRRTANTWMAAVSGTSADVPSNRSAHTRPARHEVLLSDFTVGTRFGSEFDGLVNFGQRQLNLDLW
jgi:hypothetical protein